MATAIIVQARVGSTRFKNKMTTPFHNGRGLLHYLLNRLIKSGLNIPVILAIPDSDDNDVLEEIGKNLNLVVYRGSETDVLSRFTEAAEANKADRIIRVCADNPFLDLQFLKILINTLHSTKADYVSFCLHDGTPTIKTHYGFWAEAVNTKALKKVTELTEAPEYLEHVTNYIYTHPGTFEISLLPVDPKIEQSSWARFTVDTENDFKLAKSIANQLPPNEEFDAFRLIELVGENPEIKRTMKMEIHKNKK